MTDKLISDEARTRLAAMLDGFERQDAKAETMEARAVEARTLAARMRSDARHPELEPLSTVVAPSGDRIDQIIEGAKPAPMGHADRVKLREANEGRSAVRQQLLADADALEEHAGKLHAEAERLRSAVHAQRQAFIWAAAEVVNDALLLAMRQLVTGPVAVLDGLRMEAARRGVRAPGAISVMLDALVLPLGIPRGPKLWPLHGNTLPTGERFDQNASYARLIEEIRGKNGTEAAA